VLLEQLLREATALAMVAVEDSGGRDDCDAAGQVTSDNAVGFLAIVVIAD
jgi:hypothetical protein